MLAGGLSRRMGRDKATLLYRGRTLLEQACLLLEGAGFTVAIAGVRPGRTGAGGAVPDRFPQSGPLGGIEAALSTLEHEPGQPVLFVPVDLPLLPAVFLDLLWSRAARTGALATIPWCGGRPQPLCAVYHSSLLGGIRQALVDGNRKVMQGIVDLAGAERGGLDQFRVEALAPAEAGQDPRWWRASEWFTNLNSPADYERLASR